MRIVTDRDYEREGEKEGEEERNERRVDGGQRGEGSRIEQKLCIESDCNLMLSVLICLIHFTDFFILVICISFSFFYFFIFFINMLP